MEIIVERCAGIDVGKRDVKACIRALDGAGQWRVEVRTFPTMTRDLLLLRDWLVMERITTVGMEATGAYWKPVYYLLEDSFRTQLLNARHLHNVPGRKTDVIDAEWNCRMVQLVRPWPGLGDTQDRTSDGADDPGDVQQSVAQLLRLGQGVLVVQEQGSGPGEQVDADQSEFEPGGVDGELAGREPAEPDVLVGTDPILHAGVATVAQLEELQRADRSWGVGDEHLVPQSIGGVEHRQLNAGVGPFPAGDHSGPFRISRHVDQMCELRDIGPVAQLGVGVEGWDPVHARGNRAARAGSVIATPTEPEATTPCNGLAPQLSHLMTLAPSASKFRNTRIRYSSQGKAHELTKVYVGHNILSNQICTAPPTRPHMDRSFHEFVPELRISPFPG